MTVDRLDQLRSGVFERARVVKVSKRLGHLAAGPQCLRTLDIDLGDGTADSVMRNNVAPTNDPLRFLAGRGAPDQALLVQLAEDIASGLLGGRIELLKARAVAG